MTHDDKRNGTTTLFAEIARQRIRRGVFRNVMELEDAIHEWIEQRNQVPKPFTWIAKAQPILASHRQAQKPWPSSKQDANE
jgi:hypothetical protein